MFSQLTAISRAGLTPGSSTKNVLFKAIIRHARNYVDRPMSWIAPGVSGFNRHTTAMSRCARPTSHHENVCELSQLERGLS
jgi:hypothetical protein